MKKTLLLLSIFVSAQLCADWLIETTSFDGSEGGCEKGGILITFSDTEQSEEWNDNLPKAYVCKGEKGCDAIVTASALSLPEECKGTLGIPITSGSDCDWDGNVDTGTETSFALCYGQDYSKNGKIPDMTGIGNAGNGGNGEQGGNGRTTDFVITEEEPGQKCKNGGTKIETRFDSNGNDIFESSEISVKYVCRGENGITPEAPAGEDKISGSLGEDGKPGKPGETGNAGNTGEQGEQGRQGNPGSDGNNTIMSVADEAAGNNCKNGGKKFMSGVDTDGNGILDEAEVKNSYYICNGEDAAEASDTVKESGCTVTSVSTDIQISPIISAIYEFISNLF